MSVEYFTLLELPRSFVLDEDALHRAYIQKQREFHPDRVAKASQEERAQAMQMSVEVNQAYHTLKHPLFRAEYLLKLAGAEEQKPSQMLLMESMGAREALMEATTTEALEVMKLSQQAILEGVYQDFAQSYAAHRLQDAAEAAMRIRYLQKLLEEIRARAKMLATDKAEL